MRLEGASEGNALVAGQTSSASMRIVALIPLPKFTGEVYVKSHVCRTRPCWRTPVETPSSPIVGSVGEEEGCRHQHHLASSGPQSASIPTARSPCRSPVALSAVVVVPGKGVTGRIDGREFWVGSHRHLEERGQEQAEVHAMIERLSGVGRSAVVVGNQRHVCGVITLSDRPRPGVRAALDQLRKLGIERLILLTGDNRGAAEAVSGALHFDEVRSELLPEDKVAAVRELVERNGSVAMIGDGVNDAPAMATASLGIAMGAAGSDAAIETADVALNRGRHGRVAARDSQCPTATERPRRQGRRRARGVNDADAVRANPDTYGPDGRVRRFSGSALSPEPWSRGRTTPAPGTNAAFGCRTSTLTA
jgi:soluble P-type ATPase